MSPPSSTRSDGLSRRDVFRIAALLGFCGTFPYAARAIGPTIPSSGGAQSIYQARYPLMDPEHMVATTCAGCLGSCPLRAQREAGILAKVDGNPWSPRQLGDPVPTGLRHAAELRGATCARGQARVQNVHDPYRLVRVLVRDGPRGSGRFRSLDVATALDELMDGAGGRPGLGALRERSMGGAGTPLLLAVDPRHQDRRVSLDAFARAFAGTSVLLGHPAPMTAAVTRTLLGAQGWIAAPRWDRAEVIAAWGANPIASGVDPVGSSWWMAEQVTARGGRVVAIDPRLSDAGAMAELWVPVRPGADRALAHWVARTWADLGWVPAGAVPEAVRRRPEPQLEQRTGLGPRIVQRLAGMLFGAGPRLAMAVGGGVTDHEGGEATAQAILRLAVLAGAFGPGGAMEPAIDPVPVLDGPRALASALSEAAPQALMLVGEAGVQDTVWEREVVEALADPERVPLVVASVTAMNRLAWYADYVFPDVTEFERLGLVARHDGASVVLPVVDAVPVQAGTPGPVGRGFEGLLQALLDRAGVGVDLQAAVWEALAARARLASLPALSAADDRLLDAALEGRLSEARGAPAPVRSFLARGWAPPVSGASPPSPVPWPPDASASTEPPPPEAPVLLTWRESFGGQPDSDAQAWGARSVRDDNPAWCSAELLDDLEGDHSDQLRVEGASAAVARVKRTSAIRTDCVGLAIGYGQVHGFDGAMHIDGVAVPPAPRRCCGVAVGPLLTPDRTVALAWAEPRRDPSLWDLLRPGGKPQLPSVERKHEDL